MEDGENPGLVASWKAERRCFHFTAGSAAGLCLLLFGRVGAVIWTNRHSNNPFAKSGPEVLEQLQHFFKQPLILVGSKFGLSVFALGFVFFVSLAHWVMAIEERRKAREAVGLPRKENP
jgi:hypothetical protein